MRMSRPLLLLFAAACGTTEDLTVPNVAAAAAGHGVAAAVASNNLDDILFSRIRDEIAGWGQNAGVRVAAK